MTRAPHPTGIALAGAAVTAAAMIATPLLPRAGRGRRLLSSVVVSGLFATTVANAARRWGVRRSTVAAAVTSAGTGLVERVGSRTGVPFGRYQYTPALQPQLAGVPMIVPLAWHAMAVPAREAAHAALGPRSTPWRRIGIGAAALTAWDLFLDPQMVGEGYWRWTRGTYRGIPLTNFAGWFLTGLGVMAALELTLPPHDEASANLVGEYAYMAVMETVGFARFFRDPLVASVGGAAMLPLSALAIGRLLRGR